jgi:hypothetical protein
MTEEVQRNVGMAIGLIAQFLLMYVWGGAALRHVELYLIGIGVLVVVLIMFFGDSFEPQLDANLPQDIQQERAAHYAMVRHIALMAAYAFAGGGVIVLLFF